VTERANVPVLLIEDDATMARLVRHLLEMEGYSRIKHAWTAELALAAAGNADIILLDHQLPDIRGMDLLPQLLSRPDPPSVVMVTGHGSESLAAAALRLGAEDYLTKDHTLPELLPRILERVRRNRALRTALADAEQELVKAERLAAVGELSVALHHELNNPLMAAMAEVELALADGDLPPRHREGLESARSALQRLALRLKQSAEIRRADATDYLDGLRMIDLGAAGEAAAMFRGKAVLWHPDQRVQRVLALLLRNAGFAVERVEAAGELAAAAVRLGVTLVAVPSGTDGEPPLGGFEPPVSRRYTLVALGSDLEHRARAAGADLVVALPFDPATVVGEILGAVKR
jgi:DNA-binding response OmpR family regulator